jgi:hypothetical protein
MRRRLLLTPLLAVLALCVAAPAQERAPRCAGIDTLAECPDTGCGGPGQTHCSTG